MKKLKLPVAFSQSSATYAKAWLPLVDYTVANYQDIVKRQYSMKYEKAILNYLNVSSLLSEVTR